MESWRCPKSVYEMHYSDRSDGKCNWCGRKVYAKHPPPSAGRVDVTRLTLYYEYYYDPDFASNYK